jgi:hypothetical protein
MPDKYKAEESESESSLTDYLKRFMQLPDLKTSGRAPARAIATVAGVALIAGMVYSRDR